MEKTFTQRLTEKKALFEAKKASTTTLQALCDFVGGGRGFFDDAGSVGDIINRIEKEVYTGVTHWHVHVGMDKNEFLTKLNALRKA